MFKTLRLIIKNTAIFSVIILALAVGFSYYQQFQDEINRDHLEKWSELNKKTLTNDNTKLVSFSVDFNQSEWNFLRLKLENSRHFKVLNEKYVKRNEIGFDPDYAQELVSYWKDEFNWEKRIEFINRYPQYKVLIDNEITIHFSRVLINSNATSEPIKILLLDGWLGSYFGFYKYIDHIKANYKDVSFDIIIPSIPGFGYSTPLDKPIDAVDTAQYFDALIRFVNNDENVKYFVHGEDWGSVITTYLAKMYPSRVQGIHLTMPIIEPSFVSIIHAVVSQFYSKLILTQQELEANLSASFGKPNFFKDIIKKTGYLHYQATRPDTLAHGLSDSPVGLLAYILEGYAFASFSDDAVGHKDGLLRNFDKDELLTIVTYYWMTNSISSSMRIYRSHFNGKARELMKVKTSSKVPVSIQYFKNEVYVYPLGLLKANYLNLKSFKIENKGGHFAAFENPELSAKDFINFVIS